MMKVQEVLVDGKKRRYMLLDEEGEPITIVVRYLKSLENNCKPNTLKTYCFALKSFFEYLRLRNKEFREVDVDFIRQFIIWLKNPDDECEKLIQVDFKQENRSEKRTPKPSSINNKITVIIQFYHYLYEIGKVENDIKLQVYREIDSRYVSEYKDFLYHISDNKAVIKNSLKVKEPKTKVSYLEKEEVETIYNKCSNIRDKFLIKLLFETGLRIGEALSLFIEDFIYDLKDGHRIRLVDRGELENGAFLKTGERELNVSQSLMDLFDEYMFEVIDELQIDTNFVFVKLKGENSGRPMDYNDVQSLMKRLRKKSDIYVHAHKLRHTHGTIYYRQTKNIKATQERLGHSQIQTTSKSYIGLSKKDLRDDWKRAETAFMIKG